MCAAKGPPMNRLVLTSMLVVSLAAVACSGARESADPAEHAAAVRGETELTQIVETAAGDVIADARGFSLYTFDPETTEEPACYDACATRWPPFLVEDGQTVVAPFGVTTRTDGSKQLTFAGDPLYFFAGDAEPGDVNGDGLGGVWHLARPAAALTQVVETTAGDVIADARGFSLYTFDPETTEEPACYDACATRWPPFLVEDGQTVVAPFGVTTRTDGSKQLTFAGDPLYFFAGDAEPGDVNGDGLGGVWHLARPAAE